LAVPVWTVGEILTASDVNTWFVPLVAYKTSTLSRTSTTITADPDLVLPVAANAVYEVRIMINFENPSGASAFSWNFTVPSGATGAYGGFTAAPGPVFSSLGSTWPPTNQAAASDNLGHIHNFSGTLITSTTAGSLTYQWAPTTASAGALEVFAGSSLIARRIG
jgi:hypothetical protein